MWTQAVDEMELSEVAAFMTTELCAILSTAALFSFGKVAAAPGVPPNHQQVWFNAAVQICTCLLFNFTMLVVGGKFLFIEWDKVYFKSVKRYLAYALFIFTLGGSR